MAADRINWAARSWFTRMFVRVLAEHLRDNKVSLDAFQMDVWRLFTKAPDKYHTEKWREEISSVFKDACGYALDPVDILTPAVVAPPTPPQPVPDPPLADPEPDLEAVADDFLADTAPLAETSEVTVNEDDDAWLSEAIEESNRTNGVHPFAKPGSKQWDQLNRWLVDKINIIRNGKHLFSEPFQFENDKVVAIGTFKGQVGNKTVSYNGTLAPYRMIRDATEEETVYHAGRQLSLNKGMGEDTQWVYFLKLNETTIGRIFRFWFHINAKSDVKKFGGRFKITAKGLVPIP